MSESEIKLKKIIYNYNENDDFDQIQQKLENAFDFLNSLKKHSKIIKYQSGYEAIYLIAKYVAFQTNSINFDLFIEKKAHDLYGKLLNNLYKNHSTFDFDQNKIQNENPTKDASYNEKCITIFCMTIYTCNIVMVNSLKFKLLFQQTKGLKALLKFLDSKKFVKKNIAAVINPFNSAELAIIDYIALNLSSLSSNCQENKQHWIDFDAVNIMLKLAKTKESTKSYCYNVILNVATDKQIETLSEIQNYSKELIAKVIKIGKDFSAGKFDRHSRQIADENDGSISTIQVHCSKDNNDIYYSFIIIFNSLYHLCINDKLKDEVFFSNNFKDNLKIVLKNGNEWEKQYALRLLSQLTLSEKVAVNLSKDEEFLEIINLMPFISDKINCYIDQINWNLKIDLTKSSLDNQNVLDYGHIMISYELSNRKLCLNIKDKLESFGSKVWLDLNDKHGSVTESMAKAIENSICVLICVTEKYRQSVNGRLEAHYAYRLNKPIIPLIMQSGYENVNGWLGVIICDKIFIDFVKYDFNVCMNRLKHEIEMKINFKKLEIKMNGMSFKMSQEEVDKWLKENQIDESIVKYLNNCDGILLKQLYDIKCSNSQFYDQSIAKIENISMMAVLKFNAALEKLFNI